MYFFIFFLEQLRQSGLFLDGVKKWVWSTLPRSQNTRLGVYLIEVKKQQALSPKVRIKRFTSGPQRHNSPCVFKTLICLPFGAASTFVQNTLSGKQICVRLCNLPPSWTHFPCTLWSIIPPPSPPAKTPRSSRALAFPPRWTEQKRNETFLMSFCFW